MFGREKKPAAVTLNRHIPIVPPQPIPHVVTGNRAHDAYHKHSREPETSNPYKVTGKQQYGFFGNG
jgi:hypothetical protein